ncbi:hypothetical protein BN1708_020061, partial [Verticillium longisporum]
CQFHGLHSLLSPALQRQTTEAARQGHFPHAQAFP